MSRTLNRIFLIVFSCLYIAGFAAFYLSIRDYEFLWYVGVMVFFFLLILVTLKRTKFSNGLLWGLSIWGLLHMAGGGVRIGGEVLYKLHLIDLVGAPGSELYILKYDQVVHFYGFLVLTVVMYRLLEPLLRARPGSWRVIYAVSALASMGLGAINEIIEFIAVLVVPQTNVGGYANTALDLVFNGLGTVLALILIHFSRCRSK